MNAIGRPPRACPADFEERFVELGWECVDYFRTNPRKVADWLRQKDRETLARRRKNYVMGRRLSSLKVGGKRV